MANEFTLGVYAMKAFDRCKFVWWMNINIEKEILIREIEPGNVLA